MKNDKRSFIIFLVIFSIISLICFWYSLSHTVIDVRDGGLSRKIIRIDEGLKYKNHEIICTDTGEQIIIYFDRKD